VQIDRNGSGWFTGPVEGGGFFAGYPGSGGRDYCTNLNRSLNNLRWDLGVVGGGGSYPLRLAMGHATINVSSGLLNHATHLCRQLFDASGGRIFLRVFLPSRPGKFNKHVDVNFHRQKIFPPPCNRRLIDGSRCKPRLSCVVGGNPTGRKFSALPIFL
jgi:hypothetical protein